MQVFTAWPALIAQSLSLTIPKLRVQVQPSEANVIKLFTVVIYCHSIVVLSFCVIKFYYLGNYCGMAVNYHWPMEANLNTAVIYHIILTLESVATLVNYCRIFITSAPGGIKGQKSICILVI
jgi:hypothetical protein